MQANNMQAMREALALARVAILGARKKMGVENPIILEIIEEALAEPPCNYAVGTAEEQVKRHKDWCDSNICKFTDSCRVCFAKWAQMPYTESEATDGK